MIATPALALMALMAVASASTAAETVFAMPVRDTTRRADIAGAVTFDAARADVAGLRIGGRAKDFETTAARLFGSVTRVHRSDGWYARYAAALRVNAMQCFSLPGRRHAGDVGNVCVTAFLDADDVVREVRIERVFPFVDAATFRSTLIRRYGDVAAQRAGAHMSLGWGPTVERALAYNRTGPTNALTAHYNEEDELMGRSLNAARRIRVTLQLIDAAWAAAAK